MVGLSIVPAGSIIASGIVATLIAPKRAKGGLADAASSLVRDAPGLAALLICWEIGVHL